MTTKSILHLAVLAAVATAAPQGVAKYILEGEAVDLTEPVYGGDIIGGQYVNGGEPYGGHYFPEDKVPLYAGLTDLTSTKVHIRQETTVNEELIGGTYLHGNGANDNFDEASFKIGTISVTLEGGTVGQNVFGGNKINTYRSATLSGKVDQIELRIQEGSRIEKALFLGSSVKSQHDNGEQKSRIRDVLGTIDAEVTGTVVGGVAAGSFIQIADNGAGADVEARVGKVELDISGSTINPLTYQGMNGDVVVPDYSMSVNGAVYAGGVVFNDKNGEKVTNLVGSSEVTIRNGSEIEGNVVAGGLLYLGDTVQTTEVLSKTEVGAARIAIENSHVKGDVVLGSQIVHKFEAEPKYFETALGKAVVTLSGATVDGTVRGGDLVVNGKNEGKILPNDDRTEKALVATGVNTVRGVEGVPSVRLVASEANVGPEGAPILTVKGGTVDLQDAVVTISGDESLAGGNAQLLALTEGATVTGDNTRIVGEGVFVDQVWEAGSADDLKALFADGTLSTETIDFEAVANGNARTLTDIRLGTLAFVNQGAEFIADEGLTALTRATETGSAAFAAVHGGYSEYSTGADVELESASFVFGTGTRVADLTVGAFLEGGFGSSDAGKGAVTADGDHSHYGIGLGAVWTPDLRVRFDAALRIGESSTEYDGVFGAARAKYDSDALYASIHLGGAYVWNLSEKLSAEVYGRYALGYIDGDELRVRDADGSRLTTDDAWTHTVRVGTRLMSDLGDTGLRWKAGLAYEHVFDGDSKSSVEGVRLDTPSLEGDTVVAEAALQRLPAAAGTWGWNLGLKAYAGDRKGVSGSGTVLYAF